VALLKSTKSAKEKKPDPKLQKLVTILETQEEMLQFSRFTRADVWNLGNILVKLIGNRTAVASIRLMTGLTVFQFAGEGTNWDNEFWMSRKTKLVTEFEMSSLRCTAWIKYKGDTPQGRGLDVNSYAFCGGGFPIRIKDSGLIAVALISGLYHLDDHQILVDGIADHLGVSNVPQVPMTRLLD
jgi:uncharacterized protein (UPF0303 family)